jgi:opacity protein-like surface antigen
MKKQVIAFFALLSSMATVGMATPASAQSVPVVRQSSIGPSVLFGNGQSALGIDSKFSLSDNFSLRPFVYFPSNGTDFGTAVTYDIALRNNDSSVLITPFVGASVDVNTGTNSATTFSLVGGADLDLSESLRLKGSIIVPLSNDRGQGTGIAIGAGFRF